MNSAKRVILSFSYILPLASTAFAASQWTDISGTLLARLTNGGAKVEWPGGCSGVVVNRTNGEVTIKVVGLGLWRSGDQCESWQRVDGGMISGRDETGWATSADAHAPNRIASFSLDGGAGWTSDGVHWKKFTSLGRNWDYGSVDWSAAEPKTIIAAKHETTPPGEVYLSTDSGVKWRRLSIHLNESRGRPSMIGALSSTALVFSIGDGIQRSTDGGETWSKVSDAIPQTRIPVLFRGAHYLGTTNGLILSHDLGVTWQTRGGPVDIWQGPFFGREENEMVVVGRDGIFQSRDGGQSWKRVADPKSAGRGFQFTPNWFGCYAWDPVHNAIYASAMGNQVYRLNL